MLLVLQPEDAKDELEDYVILTIHLLEVLSFLNCRLACWLIVGQLRGAAAKEIKEETGLEIQETDLIDMTRLANEQAGPGNYQENLQDAVYPSPGGSDEFIPIFLSRKRMSRTEIEGLKGKLTGLRDRGEKIALRICRLDDPWKMCARDGKTLAAVALYEGLRRTQTI
jgi:ADP-sugar diphosphatase